MRERWAENKVKQTWVRQPDNKEPTCPILNGSKRKEGGGGILEWFSLVVKSQNFNYIKHTFMLQVNIKEVHDSSLHKINYNLRVISV